MDCLLRGLPFLNVTPRQENWQERSCNDVPLNWYSISRYILDKSLYYQAHVFIQLCY